MKRFLNWVKRAGRKPVPEVPQMSMGVVRRTVYQDAVVLGGIWYCSTDLAQHAGREVEVHYAIEGDRLPNTVMIMVGMDCMVAWALDPLGDAETVTMMRTISAEQQRRKRATPATPAPRVRSREDLA